VACVLLATFFPRQLSAVACNTTITKAQLTMFGDDNAYAWVNGTLVNSQTSFITPPFPVIDITTQLGQGGNLVMEVVDTKKDNMAAWFLVTIQMSDGSICSVSSNPGELSGVSIWADPGATGSVPGAGWQNGFDANGRPEVNTSQFPDGMAATIAYIHANGQKAGIYWIPGVQQPVWSSNDLILGTSYTVASIVNSSLPGNSFAIGSSSPYWHAKLEFSQPGAQQYINSVVNRSNSLDKINSAVNNWRSSGGAEM